MSSPSQASTTIHNNTVAEWARIFCDSVAIPSEIIEQGSLAAQIDRVRQLLGTQEHKIAALWRLKKLLMQTRSPAASRCR
jgi:hypothetical protein